MKSVILAMGLLCSAAGAATDEMHWYKTELACADARITVRAFCQETYDPDAMLQRNGLCSRQTLHIERPGRRALKRNLLERQRDTGEVPLLLLSMSCVTAGDKIYLSGAMGNRGNCRECERSVLFGLDGRWKQDGRRWLVGAQEKRAILAHERKWDDSEQISIRNITRDAAYDTAVNQ
ncbi:hypothetical protein [Massilia genomosp. 1]|uniref:DUF2147 domain-containing protein n=1 Tax=Massilia genomosp. 1 TaxID=2609280 RepID=A0ABX0N0X4_9BURK|nr:hypothetical protein [Massilia genomosp. 1]NHZ66126.1 hypothetical protein [Massilia genomosp. 1]